VHLCTIFTVTLTFDAVRGAFRDNAALFVVMIASFEMAAGICHADCRCAGRDR